MPLYLLKIQHYGTCKKVKNKKLDLFFDLVCNHNRDVSKARMEAFFLVGITRCLYTFCLWDGFSISLISIKLLNPANAGFFWYTLIFFRLMSHSNTSTVNSRRHFFNQMWIFFNGISNNNNIGSGLTIIICFFRIKYSSTYN